MNPKIFILTLCILTACQPQPSLAETETHLPSPATFTYTPSLPIPVATFSAESTSLSLPTIIINTPKSPLPPGEFTLLQPTYIPPAFGEPSIEHTDLGGGFYYHIPNHASLVILQYPLPVPKIIQKHLQTDYPPEEPVNLHVNQCRAHYSTGPGLKVLWYQDEQRLYEIVFSASPTDMDLLTQSDLVTIALGIK